LYTDSGFDCQFSESSAWLEWLMSKLHQYYDNNLEKLKAKKQDHLKSFVQVRSETLGSPTRHLENDPNQKPLRKAEIINNAVNALNAIGTYVGHNRFEKKDFKVCDKDINAAKKLFEANPELTPHHILQIMETCFDLDKERPTPVGESDDLWHVRRGKDLGFLLRNLNTIIHHEAVSIDIPVRDLLSSETMYGPKRERD
jgi:hypothetical protein